METDLSKNYNEILRIIELLGPEYATKVPKKLLSVFEVGKDPNYISNLSIDDFYSGNYMEDTKTLVSILYINYWSQPQRKEELMNLIREKDAERKAEREEKLMDVFHEKEREKHDMTEPKENKNSPSDIKISDDKNSLKDSIIEILNKIKTMFKK